MSHVIDPVQLTADLIRCDTAGHSEDSALDLIESLLRPAGFILDRIPWQPGRSNLVARHGGGGRLTFAAHVDTVPFDARQWTVDPLGADIRDGRIFGRGSSDMKSGTAATVSAAIAAVQGECAPFSMVFTSAEETGCLGAAAVKESALLDPDPILIIGESTANEVRLGHKGATWVTITARGTSAHGSRPDLGVNAIYLLADAMQHLRSLATIAGGLGQQHPVLGEPTMNVGTIAGGQQANLVPAHAEMTVDFRTVRDGDVDAILADLAAPAALTAQQTLNVRSVWTDPQSLLSQELQRISAAVTATSPRPAPVPYFTDAAVLAGREPLAYICGPGDPDQPHTVDESCSVAAIGRSADIYRDILAAWTRGALG